MKVAFRFTLRKKIVSLILGVVLVAILGTLWVAVRAFIADKRDYVMELSVAAAPNAAAAVTRYFNAIGADLVAFDEALRSTDPSSDLDRLIRAASKEARGVECIEVYDASGLLARTRVAKVPCEAHSDLVSGLFKSGEPQFARRLVGSKGRLVFLAPVGEHAYLVQLRSDSILEVLEPARALSAMLIADDGSVVVGAPTDSSNAIRADGLRDLVASLRSRSGQSVIGKELRLNSAERVLTAVSLVPGVQDLAVATRVPESQIFRLFAQLAGKIGPVIGIILAFSVATGVYLSTLITRPIEDLTLATARIASGNWRVSFRSRSARSKDEIGALSSAFSRMGTELERRESELKRASEELLKSEQLATLGRFSAGLAHEVKNPLNSIQGFSQLLQRQVSGKLSAEEMNSLKIIVDETRRATRIISDLLIFSKQKQPARSSFRITEVADRAVELFSPTATAEGIEVTNSHLDGEPQVNVDRDQLLQVFQNLMINASHAMQGKEGSGPKRLAISTAFASEEGEVVVSVKDNGSGITDENLKKLFQPFFSTKGVGKGTGLGLATCHGIVLQHGGRITVTSAVGQGTAFHIHLPIAGRG